MAKSCTDCAPFTSHAGSVGQEFLICDGKHFSRLVGRICILISERDMIVLKYGARLSLKGSLPFSSLLQGSESWDLLVFIHHSPALMLLRGNWYITLCTDVSTKVTKKCPLRGIAADWSFSWSLLAADWLAERKMWDRFELIFPHLGIRLWNDGAFQIWVQQQMWCQMLKPGDCSNNCTGHWNCCPFETLSYFVMALLMFAYIFRKHLLFCKQLCF